jgi:hypothetical protein
MTNVPIVVHKDPYEPSSILQGLRVPPDLQLCSTLITWIANGLCAVFVGIALAALEIA